MANVHMVVQAVAQAGQAVVDLTGLHPVVVALGGFWACMGLVATLTVRMGSR